MGGVLLEGALKGAGVGEGTDAVLAMAEPLRMMMYSLVDVPEQHEEPGILLSLSLTARKPLCALGVLWASRVPSRKTTTIG